MKPFAKTLVCLAYFMLSCSGPGSHDTQRSEERPPAPREEPNPSKVAPDEDPDPPEVALGEKFFNESRFSHAYAEAWTDGDAMPPRDIAEKVTAEHLVAVGENLTGSFKGEGMSCRHCHLVDEHAEQRGRVGSRAYSDFAPRTPIPDRGDGRDTTLRNTQQMVDIGAAADASRLMLHHDAEFATIEDLVRATLTGRNMGWLPSEAKRATQHVAAVAKSTTLGYSDMLTGKRPVEPDEDDYLIPERFRVASDASDEEYVRAVVRLITAYVKSLRFARDEDGHIGSPYDRFLLVNELPRAPAAGETDGDYTTRLRRLLAERGEYRLVDDGTLSLHGGQPFRFGEQELRGLKLFLSDADAPAKSGGVGECASCHPAPLFTDFGIHNTGVSQLEYDRAHGNGRFAELAIPNLTKRQATPARYLPPDGQFFRVPDSERPELADLGVWNVAANPSVSDATRARIQHVLVRQYPEDADDDDALLRRAIGAFVTPRLRNLGHTEPYLHDGSAHTIEAVVDHYRQIGELARTGQVRNGDQRLTEIQLSDDDAVALAAFLRALNEDYD
ncbi:MAG: cytochrome c peroxidase [Haliangiales bacterium]